MNKQLQVFEVLTLRPEKQGSRLKTAEYYVASNISLVIEEMKKYTADFKDESIEVVGINAIAPILKILK